jgi:hypothetical protein
MDNGSTNKSQLFKKVAPAVLFGFLKLHVHILGNEYDFAKPLKGSFEKLFWFGR